MPDANPSDDNLHRFSGRMKRLLPTALWRPARALATGIMAPLRFAFTTGHFRSSLAMSAHAADGEAIPWYTYPAIDFLAQRDFTGRNVLEFGGGQSTLWWSKRAASVLTFEENAGWLERVKAQVGPNATLHNVPIDSGDPIAEIRRLIAAHPVAKFDVIVVDGHLREKATAIAFDYLAPGGALLLDNAEGYGFYEETSKRDCRRVDFFGFAPGVVMRHCTSLVYLGDCFLLSGKIPIPYIERV